jgi:mycothiol synthase
VNGFAAIEYHSGAEAAEARLALLPAQRQASFAERLLAAARQLAREAGAPLVRLYVPAGATWATGAASEQNFRAVRTQQIMLRSPAEPPLDPFPVAGVKVRPLLAGEEPQLLAALNRAWAGTWNARPLTPEVLSQDLAGQRSGMLVAVDEGVGTIVATAHAQYSAESSNPDGRPYAWISNLTVDPAWRGRGFGRAMLAAGLAYLRDRGARSVALGVDGGATIPLTLYQSAGFTPISTVVILERPTYL